MQKLVAVFFGIFVYFVGSPVQADWFEQNTPLTQAHEHLLNNDLAKMFDSMVEVWQSNQSTQLSNHLNDLLLQSLNADCGKGLVKTSFPDWISSLSIRRVEIQSPGRDAFQLLIDLVASSEVKDVSLTKWLDHSISLDTSFSKINRDNVTDKDQAYVKRYNLNNRLVMGLYRLIVSRKTGGSWSTWVILDNPKAYHTIHWTSNEQWDVVKTAIPNPYCPLPKMRVSVYNFQDGKYSEVWRKTYESNYPTHLPDRSLPPDRYILAVSMNHQRWQGPITIEQSQVISKNYDISLEE